MAPLSSVGNIFLVSDVVPEGAQKQGDIRDGLTSIIKKDDKITVKRRLGSGWVLATCLRTNNLHTIRLGSYLTKVELSSSPPLSPGEKIQRWCSICLGRSLVARFQYQFSILTPR